MIITRVKLILHACIATGLILFHHPSVSQNQLKADSLLLLHEKGGIDDSLSLVVLHDLTFEQTNPKDRLRYAKELLSIASIDNNFLFIHRSYIQMGHAYRLLGELDSAAFSFYQSLINAKKANYLAGEGSTYLALGDMYSVDQDHNNSIKYYNRAISILRSEADSVALATALLNAGDEYFNVDKLDSAILQFEESGNIFKEQNYLIGIAYNLGNIGMVYAKKNKHILAEQKMSQAIAILSELSDFYPIAVYDTYMADIYKEKGDIPRALTYAMHSLNIAKSNGLKEQMRDASLKLSELYELNKDYQNAHQYQSQYITYRDSIGNEETIRKMADLRTAFEVSQKQVEIDLLENRQRMQNITFASMAMVIVLLAFLAFMYYRNNKRKQVLNMIITERKEEVEAQRDQLEGMNETREKFLSIIAHDLWGPVNSFKGFSQIMKYSIDQNDTEDLKEIHTQFEKSVDGLSSLLTNLLDWSVTQQGTIPYKPEKVELKTVADELVNLFTNMAATKQINLKSIVPADIHMWVDINCVKTILRNIVSNAIKFTIEGGSITVSSETVKEMVVIKVQDTGIGISKEKLNTLLDTNNYNRSWGTKGEKGLGLGLQLVKEFTELNKGTIHIDSKENVGTSIIVSLPLWQSNIQEKYVSGRSVR